ncbi:MAG: citrate transporter [Spirochaetaceae bacterium]|jgi:Na+/H+ antiporter NhaD/arsenite permease-like protein|nr:citrate transporter [Spirochaetaceae bacterium]
MDFFEPKWIALGITALMYLTGIAVPSKKMIAALAAAVLVLVFGIVKPLYAFTVLINWSVLLIYIGSLVIAELFIYSRVPVRIADNIVNTAPNTGIAIVTILIITGLISAFVENVATVLVMAPIALALSRKMDIRPTYFMVGLAVMANLQGTALLVGDPPSMIFASFANYGFNDFIFYHGKMSIFFVVQFGMLAGALYFYFIFAKDSKQKITVEKEPVLSLFPTILLILMIAGLAFCSFFFDEGLTPQAGIYVFALGIAGIFWYKCIRKESGTKTWKLVKGLDWETIFFLIGIFVVIGALAETGILNDFALLLSKFTRGNKLAGFVLILIVSVIISGFIDNVPYIIAMLPVASEMAAALGIRQELYLFALLIGSCLGGNLTCFGASANIVAVGILKKEGITLNFAGWLKIGLPFTLLTTLAAALFLWFVWK